MGGIAVAKKMNTLAKKFISAMDLPEDVVLDLPQIKLVGNTEVIIENHKGVHEYKSTLIRLAIKGNLVSVSGRNLLIQFIGRDDIKIKGRIDKVEFQQ